MNFDTLKQDALSKKDKSSIGKWDKKIINLCKKINSKKNYYTTSSCSGRIVLIEDKGKKQSGLFGFVSHDLISLNDIKKTLKKLTSLRSDINKKQLIKKARVNRVLVGDFGRVRSGATINNYIYKQEPCILHVACKEFKDAEVLLKKAQLAGWKRSGIIATGNKFVCELLSTEKLEFPIVVRGKILVEDVFLKEIVKKSNKNLVKSWLKIQRLFELM